MKVYVDSAGAAGASAGGASAGGASAGGASAGGASAGFSKHSISFDELSDIAFICNDDSSHYFDYARLV